MTALGVAPKCASGSSSRTHRAASAEGMGLGPGHFEEDPARPPRAISELVHSNLGALRSRQ